MTDSTWWTGHNYVQITKFDSPTTKSVRSIEHLVDDSWWWEDDDNTTTMTMTTNHIMVLALLSSRFYFWIIKFCYLDMLDPHLPWYDIMVMCVMIWIYGEEKKTAQWIGSVDPLCQINQFPHGTSLVSAWNMCSTCVPQVLRWRNR